MTHLCRSLALLLFVFWLPGLHDGCVLLASPPEETTRDSVDRDSSQQGQLEVRRQDYGEFIPNQSVLKTPLRIGTKDLQRGLGSHSHSEIIVRLPAPGGRFTALIGVDHNRDTEGGRGSVEFGLPPMGFGLIV